MAVNPFCRPALLVCLALVPSTATAQAFDVVVSLVAPDQLGSEAVGDGELITHAPGQTARVGWPAETLSLLAGELGTNGLHHVFGDIDALHDGGGATADQGLYLSLVSDEAGFSDGDVLRAGPDGFSVFLSEGAFAAAAGSVDGNVDVDAFHLDPTGLVLFSFADVEDSTTLSGDAIGVIADGDILSWLPPDGPAEIVFTEGKVDVLVANALGTSVTTGDTKGLARDPTTGEVLFVVQAPSAHDGSVFSTAAGGTLVGGHTEADFGFTGNVELDAVSVVDRGWPDLTVSSARPTSGETVTFSLGGAEASTPHVVLLALSKGPSLLDTAGWGGLVLAPDALFDVSLANFGEQSMVSDGLGQATLSLTVPSPHPPLDVVIQAASLVPPHATSNPVLVEVAQ